MKRSTASKRHQRWSAANAGAFVVPRARRHGWKLDNELPYHTRKNYYARSARVYFTVASYWLIDNFTSITRAAGTTLKLYHTGELVLSCARHT